MHLNKLQKAQLVIDQSDPIKLIWCLREAAKDIEALEDPRGRMSQAIARATERRCASFASAIGETTRGI